MTVSGNAGATDTNATAGGFTVSDAVPLFPSLVAVIVTAALRHPRRDAGAAVDRRDRGIARTRRRPCDR